MPTNGNFGSGGDDGEIKNFGRINKFDVEQQNGQRKYGGPPNGWVGPPPPKGSEVYVTGLAKHYTEVDLIPLFERVGKIYCLRIMMDFRGECRGFCYVRYGTPLEAARAIEMFNGHQMEPGVTLRVLKSLDNCRLFIGKISPQLTKERIFEVFSNNTEGLVDVILYKSPTDKNLNRGYCFLEYDSHKSAALARRHFLSDGIGGFDFPFLVDWAEPEPEIDPHIFNTVTVMYVRNLMAQTSEASIRIAISNFVSPQYVTRVKKINDFAFVHFKSHEVCDFAIKKFNGFVLDGAELEATWAKPIRQKLTAVVGAPFIPKSVPPATSISENGSDTVFSMEINTEVSIHSSQKMPAPEKAPNDLFALSWQLLNVYPPSMALEILIAQVRNGVCTFNYYSYPNCVCAQIIIMINGVIDFCWPHGPMFPANNHEKAREIVSRAFFNEFIFRIPPL